MAENTSHPANVRVGRHRRTTSALQRGANSLVKKAAAFLTVSRGRFRVLFSLSRNSVAAQAAAGFLTNMVEKQRLSKREYMFFHFHFA
ncbi:MAG: hypothetical protein IJZ66_07765, partial [Oscillibacter sp.]|nr:hypothetical protein [Oscillibacter sp.]